MGTSLISIHIFGSAAPEHTDVSFVSHASNRLTCTDNLTEKGWGFAHKTAKLISKQIDVPILCFGVFDSEMIWLEFFQNGTSAARYSDGAVSSNRKLYDIPAMVGYRDGQKKRLSHILACSDTDRKISMLEEFFGVCLLYHPELEETPNILFRAQEDKLYRDYLAEEKALSGAKSPISLKLIREYPGKLFFDTFGNHTTVKPHFFLYGFCEENCRTLTPMQFTGTDLAAVESDVFQTDRIIRQHEDPRFEIHYGTRCKAGFSELCPPAYRGKTMTLPNGFYPVGFLPSGELLLEGNGRIFFADDSCKIVAKSSIKGEVADVLDRYILTVSGDSFCGYCYDPKAKIRIYETIKK